MSKTYYAAVGGIFFGIFGIGMVAAELNVAANPFDWIKSWQTLLTGILAVAAAFFTIQQMRSSDELAMKRHEELMWINHQAAYAALQILEIEVLPKLQQVLDKLDAFDSCLSANPFDSKAAEKSLTQLQKSLFDATKLRNEPVFESIKAAPDRVLVAFVRFETSVENVNSATSQIYGWGAGGIAEIMLELVSEHQGSTEAAIGDLRQQASAIVEQHATLLQSYKNLSPN